MQGINSVANRDSVSLEPHSKPQQGIKDPQDKEFSQLLKNIARQQSASAPQSPRSLHSQQNSANGTNLAPKEFELLAKIFAENWSHLMTQNGDDVSAQSFFKQQISTTMLSEPIANMLKEALQDDAKNKQNKIKNKKNLITKQLNNVENTKNIKSKNNVITE